LKAANGRCAEPFAVQELSALRHATDERAHLGDQFGRRLVASFGVRVVFVHDHESHVVSPFLSGERRVWTLSRGQRTTGAEIDMPHEIDQAGANVHVNECLGAGVSPYDEGDVPTESILEPQLIQLYPVLCGAIAATDGVDE
jgi:hypothetical protein